MLSLKADLSLWVLISSTAYFKAAIQFNKAQFATSSDVFGKIMQKNRVMFWLSSKLTAVAIQNAEK